MPKSVISRKYSSSTQQLAAQPMKNAMRNVEICSEALKFSTPRGFNLGTKKKGHAGMAWPWENQLRKD
jgi:hypothetical protein